MKISFRAFTYIELMVVLTVITLLAVIAIPNFLEAQTRSTVSRARSELAILKMAVEQYRQEYKAFPPNREPGKPNGFDLVVLTTPVPFIGALPLDPFTGRESNKDRTYQIPAMPYAYFNAVQVNPQEGLRQKDPVHIIPGSFIAGLLWSQGPNTPWPARPDLDTSISMDGMAEVLVYDATNGTMSGGDIYTAIP